MARLASGTHRAAVSIAVIAGLAGCFPHQDVALHGNADGVLISYVGDIAETLPIARQHCAQYERQPVLRDAKDNTAVYACVRGNPGP